MCKPRFRSARAIGILLLLLAVAIEWNACGSGLNTVVVVNQNSANSAELANYFCERRQVPPENVLRISWPGNNIAWTVSEFQTTLLNPLLAMLASRRLTNQIDYIVLSMDIPFQTTSGTLINSTTAALYYGWQPMPAVNSYAASEASFRTSRPLASPGYSFLATMITAESLATAKRLVDQGVLSDGTFPTGRAILARSSDPLRNVRHDGFDRAIFDTQVRGNYNLVRTNSDSPAGQSNLLGYQTGLAGFSISSNTFVPGAIADSMTSFGGIIFGPNGQTTLLAFINAGAAGSYGTVTEPYVDLRKFPDPEVYFYQARGFTLAECYYQSLVGPYEGLIVGEPLAAPFARAGSGRWSGVSSNAVLSGTTQLGLQFSAADRERPLQQVDLFVDGKYLKTLTNIVPQPDNVLSVTLGSSTLTHTVSAGASIGSIAAQLSALINTPANSNATGVAASAHGDRIELRSFGTNSPAPPTGLRLLAGGGNSVQAAGLFAGSSAGSAPALTTFLHASREGFLPSPIGALKVFTVNGTAPVGSWLRLRVTKSSGVAITVSVTNQSSTASVFDLAGSLASAVNSTPGLQDFNGVSAEGVTRVWDNIASFDLRARKPGASGAGIKARLTGSAGLSLDPAVEVAMIDNTSDLQARNHLYVTTGATNLAFTFTLATRTLPDGYHELTAVAYEGSHVRTQTRTALSVRVQNTGLSASLNLLDLPATAPVQGAYQIQVAANAPDVSAITLFSTGGALNTITNQNPATFSVNAAVLAAGLHPFYALVETSAGTRYRTQTQWVRFVP